MVAVEGFLAPGYSQVSQPISDLGAYALYGSIAILQNVNFWAFGVLVIAFAFGLHKSVEGAKTIAGILALVGAMVFLAGLFPDQPFPLPGAVHALVSVVAFISVIVCQLLAWRRFSKGASSGVWGRYGTYSLASGILTLALLILFAATQSSLYLGVTQRMFIAVPWIWIEVVALKLLRS